MAADLLQVRLCRRCDNAVPNCRAAREGNLLDAHVFREQLAGGIAVAVDHVDDAWRETSLADELAHHHARERRLLGQLHHDGAAHRQAGPEFPGLH